MINSHFLREFVFVVDKIYIQQLSFQIILFDKLYYFVRFWIVSSNSIASPIPQN